MTGFGYNVHGFGAGGDLIFNITISSSTNDFNLASYLSSNTNYSGTDKVTINLTIDADVVVGSTSHMTPAFQTGTIGFATTGSVLNITNNGTIQGAGGRGGHLNDGNNGNTAHADGGANKGGGDGGTALKTTMTTIIDNTNGSLLGGSGGAGVGGQGNTGADGNATNGGSGGAAGGSESADGGDGGDVGQAGSAGDNHAQGFQSVGAGGAAGKYLEGNSNTTFTANGTRTGDVS